MKVNISKAFGLTFAVVLMLCTIPTILPVTRAQPPAPAFWIEPATENFGTANVTVGSLFNVTVCGAALNGTVAWSVQLGFDASQLQAVAVKNGEFFAGHTVVEINPTIDNAAGNVLTGEVLIGGDYIGPASGSLLWVTFEITAVPAKGQSLTSLIDPSYGVASSNTCFVNSSINEETPLTITPCQYTFTDSAVWSPNPTFVYCQPNPAKADFPVTCTASVSGSNPTGTVVWTTNSSTGSFNSSECILSDGTCSTTYFDTSTGTVIITASYNGDSDNTPSNGTTILEINSQAGASSTFISCWPNPVHVDASASLTATVFGYNPTGAVIWSTNSSTGCFSSQVCILSYGSCATAYTDSSCGTVTITASYVGDSSNNPSSGSTTLEINTQPEVSSTCVYPSVGTTSTYANSSVAYTATVFGFNPTGTITWSSNSSTGLFNPSFSTLSYGSCSTAYTDSSPGTVTITASYSGDTNNTPSSATATLTLFQEPTIPTEFLLNVPYHRQINGYYCGPAALEEVFGFYGPDVPQSQIGNIARTTPDGTYNFDLFRAAMFSSLSNSAESQPGTNVTGFSGYSARSLGYAALQCYGMTVEELKAVIAAGYPVIVLTTWHFRVAVGYDQTSIIFQDPYYGSMYRMTYDAFSSDWDYSGHWALLVSPLQVQISNPHNVMPGDVFNVTATVTYPGIYPFNADFALQAISVNATISLPSGLTLLQTETAQEACTNNFGPGQSSTVSWQVQSQTRGNYKISVEAEGLVTGDMPAEPPTYKQPYLYQDRIGGTNESTLAATPTPDTIPPITADDYDGSWHSQPFAINLTASDNTSGVLESYYRINGGPMKTLTLDGEPLITTPGANNTLEYWSVDWASNEELPHKLLTDIKLDTTPPSLNDLEYTSTTNLRPHQDVQVTINATDRVSGIQNITLLYSFDNGTSWTHQAMTLDSSTQLYTVTIPGQQAGTVTRFDLTAFDQAGNTATLTNGSSDFTYEVPPLSANMTCELDPLNLGFKGQWLTFCLKPPEGYSLDSINVASLMLNDSILANPMITSIVTDKNEVPTLLVCFNRTTVSQFVLSSGLMTGQATLGFKGKLDDGSLFKGICSLRVRMPGDVNSDGKVDMRDVSCAAAAFGSTLGQTSYKAVLDENEDGRIDMRDIATIARNFGKTYGKN